MARGDKCRDESTGRLLRGYSYYFVWDEHEAGGGDGGDWEPPQMLESRCEARKSAVRCLLLVDSLAEYGSDL